MAMSALPEGAAILILGPSALDLARRLKALLPRAEIHARADRGIDGDHTFTDATAHLRALFTAGTPIIGICAAGILVRALAPLIADKRVEPPIVAVAEDGSVAIPVLGGHHGANALARAIAVATGSRSMSRRRAGASPIRRG
jgi:cobalt-precorrin 5A hydrolase / precorrin-3B C17-methyltransferase